MPIGTMSIEEASFVSGRDDGQGAQTLGLATGGASSQRRGDGTAGHIQSHRTQGGRVAEHVGVGSIGQRTIALSRFDAAPQLIGLRAAPHGAKIVVVLAQVAHRLGTNTTRPHIAIGGNLR